MIAALAIPGNDMAEFVGLPRQVREDITLWLDVCRAVEGAERKQEEVARQADRLSHVRGGSAPSIWRRYYAWQKGGGNWRVFIDRAKLPKRSAAGMVERIYKYYAECNKASSLEAYNSMIRDLRMGKVLAPEGVTWRDVWRVDRAGQRMPDHCPSDYRPKGWSYRNLQERHGLSKYEAKAVRIGRGAAADFLPPVLTTRAGLKVMQMVQFDDMHHNTLVNFPGNSKAYTPLEFAAVDVLSGCRFAYGLRPIVEGPDGKRQQLKEHEFRFLCAKVLTEWGYRPEGTVWVVEHGTAAIRAPLREKLSAWTNGALTFRDSGILGEQVHAGMFPGSKRGNFKVKAVLESGHRLAQHMAAALPGYTGTNSRENRPEELVGRESYNKELLEIAAALTKRAPERAAMLMSPVLSFDEYVRCIGELYEVMNWRHEHEMEGFREAGMVATEFRVHPDARDWFGIAKLQAMQPAQRAAIEALIESDPASFSRSRLMAPQEVFNGGATGLQRLSKWHVPEIIGEEGGHTVTVRDDGLIRFDRREFGPGATVYWSTVTTPSGYRMDLRRGAAYMAHVNPLSMDEAFVTDLESGAVLGIAALYSKPIKTDLNSIHELMGKQSHARARLEAPIRERHQADADQLAAMREHNRRVAEGADLSPDEIARERRLESFDDADATAAAYAWQEDEPAEAAISTSEISNILRD